ncbi:MAG: hypothetical protein KDI13_01845 [Alphaproteobacteria bacterium]|nr:hypothetical protein [Alphaproteobacteria bacterium]
MARTFLPLSSPRHRESGNIIFMILLAIVLIGALTAALHGSSQTSNNIDRETLIIRVSEVKRYASELERGVAYIIQGGHSEADIRFASPDADADYGDLSSDTDKTDQVFDSSGGAARYRLPPDGVNDGSKWEFYGQTALPNVGTDAAELVAVLPNVTSDFCTVVNNGIGYSAQPTDSSDCVSYGASGRFDDGTQFPATPNTVDTATFSVTPALEGCVKCTADGSYNYFRVLLAR